MKVILHSLIWIPCKVELLSNPSTTHFKNVLCMVLGRIHPVNSSAVMLDCPDSRVLIGFIPR